MKWTRRRLWLPVRQVFLGLSLLVTGPCLALVFPACNSTAEPSGSAEKESEESTDLEASGPKKSGEEESGEEKSGNEKTRQVDPVAEAVAAALADACEEGQEAQAFPWTNRMDYIGAWKPYNVSCVVNGESVKRVRAWAPDAVVEDPELIAAEGRPLSRAVLRRIVGQEDVKLRPAANMLVKVVLPDKARTSISEDPMSDLDTPDQAWIGKFSHPRIVVADGTGDRLLEFDVERLETPDYVTVRVTLDGEGPVEVVGTTPIEPNK